MSGLFSRIRFVNETNTSIRSSSDKEAARAAYEKALAIQPNFGLGQRELGRLLFQAQKYSEAALHLAKAVELGVKEPAVYNSLGVSYSQTNRLKKGGPQVAERRY